MLLAAQADVFKFVTDMATIITPIALAWIVYLQVRSKAKEELTAKKVEQVKTTLEENVTKTDAKLTDIQETGEKTHALSNSAFGSQLEVYALLAEKMAALSGDIADKKIAESARRHWEEHQEKQALVDAGHSAKIAGSDKPGTRLAVPLEVAIVSVPEAGEK